jgi:ABC-2 type transport system ATP-binding protein
MSSILRFTGVHRSYRKGVDVLDGIDLAVQPGQVVGLIGKNGAGKTTLIRIAIGMLAPQRGRVAVFGEDPREKPVEVKRRIGYVSEDQVLPGFLTPRRVFDLHRELYPDWDDAMADDLIDRFGLPLDSKIKTLSKGQARQVALLAAVAHRPELLLLDEPAGGLDPAARREFLETSIRLLNEAGTTILFSSHYMTDVERMADRIVMIHDGKLLLDSELDTLREEFSLALVPADGDARHEALVGAAPCMGVRKRSDVLHAVFRMGPDAALRFLDGELGIRDARCTGIGLEEMFIELAGGGS